jgi:tetratricopeptide (TPR) repeat protein
LRGRIHWNKFSLEGFSRAFAFFQRAVQIAPDYALPYTGLADYYNFLGVYTVQPFSVTSAASKEYAMRAVSLDPSLSEGYAALGFATLMHDFDWLETEKHFRRAIELNPNYVLARVWYCYFLGMQKRFDEAFSEVNYALSLDSITPIVPQTLNWTFYYARRYEESVSATRSLIAREPNYGLSHLFLSVVLSTVGEYDDAISAGQKAVELIGKSPYTLTWLASTYAAAGRHEKTFSLLAELKEMSKNRYVSPYLLGMAYCNLGDKERALSQLETAMAIRDARLMWLLVDPQFDSLRNDSRFQSLLLRTGNPAV